MSFISSTNNFGSDTLSAQSAGQTLTGGAGIDLLIGYSGFDTTFRDTAAGLDGDTIELFGGTDQIDITDIAFSTLSEVTYSGSVTQNVLTVTDGTHYASITLMGRFVASGFHTASDNDAGTLITYAR
jgi:Ca2+-binding RTX toxin-like protein